MASFQKQKACIRGIVMWSWGPGMTVFDTAVIHPSLGSAELPGQALAAYRGEEIMVTSAARPNDRR